VQAWRSGDGSEVGGGAEALTVTDPLNVDQALPVHGMTLIWCQYKQF
jgi:uncharacterized protein (UPF0147 family)